jgi:Zn-dependent M28 family amino/carboxypeptidase
VECYINSKFHHRKITVGVAEIGEEEVVGVAPICYPKYEANDNASGASSLMEMRRAHCKQKVRKKTRRVNENPNKI